MSTDKAHSAATLAETRSILRQTGRTAGTNRAFFERVVALMGSDPGAAHELASRWKAFSEYGDEPAYALRAKAVGERIIGKWKTAGESFIAASKLTGGALDEAVFAIGAIDSLARAGDVERAVAIGRRIARSLEKLGERGHAGRARLNIGNALLFADDYKRAAREYSKASALLRGTPFKRDAASAELGFSGSELFGGSVAASALAAENAATAFDSLGDVHYADLARLNLAHCHLLQGRGDDARVLLAEISPRLTGSPPDAVRCEEFLGDAYFRLNLYEEALDAYASALSRREIRQMPLNHATATFCTGLALAALGRSGEARKHFRNAVRMFGKLGNLPWQGAALTAEAVVSQDNRAASLLGRAISTLRTANSRYHLCLAYLSFAERFGDPKALRAAEKLIKSNGYGFLRWRVDASRARSAKGGGRLRHWRSMFESLLEERLITSSTSSRAAFFRDKHVAVAEYLGHLLDRKKPMIDEALSVVTRSRSIALVDELLAVEKPQMSSAAKASLEDLRAAIAEETNAPRSDGSRRRPGVSSLTHLQRRWAETEFAQVIWSQASSARASHDMAVFAETDRGYYCIHRGTARPLLLHSAELASLVRRVEFDLLSPMVGHIDVEGTEATLSKARAVLQRGFSGVPSAIVPEGALWGLPWPALLDFEPVLRTNPGFEGGLKPSRLKRVVVWAHDPGDLPSVRAEIEAVTRVFPDAEIVSTVGAASASLKDHVDLLHVASHATTRVESPMYSSLDLEDGPLLSVEVARSRGTVGLVTLSACDTGRVSLRMRTEAEGLVRSFLALGANAVVGSLWPLDDRAAMATMSAYYGHLQRTLNVKDSLAAARAHVRRKWLHPYYWAPLAIFGGYGRHKSR
jgi:tetratricopeptide (TPR) repeat protein